MVHESWCQNVSTTNFDLQKGLIMFIIIENVHQCIGSCLIPLDPCLYEWTTYLNIFILFEWTMKSVELRVKINIIQTQKYYKHFEGGVIGLEIILIDMFSTDIFWKFFFQMYYRILAGTPLERVEFNNPISYFRF